MSETQWWIHLTHPGGETSVSFRGTEVDAAKKAASYIGKPASWDMTRHVPEPNLWDTYIAARIEKVAVPASQEPRGTSGETP